MPSTKGAIRIMTGATSIRHFMSEAIAEFRFRNPQVSLEFRTASTSRTASPRCWRTTRTWPGSRCRTGPDGIEQRPVLRLPWALAMRAGEIYADRAWVEVQELSGLRVSCCPEIRVPAPTSSGPDQRNPRRRRGRRRLGHGTLTRGTRRRPRDRPPPPRPAPHRRRSGPPRPAPRRTAARSRLGRPLLDHPPRTRPHVRRHGEPQLPDPGRLGSGPGLGHRGGVSGLRQPPVRRDGPTLGRAHQHVRCRGLDLAVRHEIGHALCQPLLEGTPTAPGPLVGTEIVRGTAGRSACSARPASGNGYCRRAHRRQARTPAWRNSTPPEISRWFHGSGRWRYPRPVMTGTISSRSTSATRTWTSMQSFAARPGTEVEPTWSIASASGPSASAISADNCSNSRGHAARYSATITPCGEISSENGIDESSRPAATPGYQCASKPP